MRTYRKRLAIVLTSFLGVLFVVAVCLAIGPKLFGVTPYVLETDEMQPTYSHGALIFVKDRHVEDVLVGDVVTYFENQGEKVVTRRIVAIDSDRDGFLLKGDANRTADIGLVNRHNLIGEPIFHIPYIGYLFSDMAMKVLRYVFLAMLVITSIIIAAPYGLHAYQKRRA